jgi:hypothetical protein
MARKSTLPHTGNGARSSGGSVGLKAFCGKRKLTGSSVCVGQMTSRRPEARIATVSHFGTILNLCNRELVGPRKKFNFPHLASAWPQGGLVQMFKVKNAESYAMILSDEHQQGTPQGAPSSPLRQPASADRPSIAALSSKL